MKTLPAERRQRNFVGNHSLKIAMLAPISAVGGIATWARTFLKYADPGLCTYEIIDTTVHHYALGKKIDLRSAVLALRDAAARLVRLLKVVLTLRPDLVYFTCAPSIGLVVRDSVYLFVLKLLRVPTVAHLHGGDTKGFFGGNFLRRWVVRSALKTCRQIIAITREVEKTAQDIFGNDSVVYLPNMIDDAILQHRNERSPESPLERQAIRLLNVGWQSPVKGSLDLIEALRYVSRPVSCTLVGVAADENRKAIETRIRELDLTGCAHLVGEKTGKELIEAFRNADIFILPSHSEGFPMVILEAMAYGLPIIGSDVGNISEMIAALSDAPCGLLLENHGPDKPQRLAQLIDKLASDPGLRKKFGENGSLRIRLHYLASVVVPGIEQLLLELCFADSRVGIGAGNVH